MEHLTLSELFMLSCAIYLAFLPLLVDQLDLIPQGFQIVLALLQGLLLPHCLVNQGVPQFQVDLVDLGFQESLCHLVDLERLSHLDKM